MGTRTWYWCPNGCGKTVFYLPMDSKKLNLKKGWNCRDCDYYSERGQRPDNKQSKTLNLI